MLTINGRFSELYKEISGQMTGLYDDLKPILGIDPDKEYLMIITGEMARSEKHPYSNAEFFYILYKENQHLLRTDYERVQ